MNLAGIGLALAMAIVTGDSHPAIAFAQQSATWVSEDRAATNRKDASMNRRDFLRSAGIASASLALPRRRACLRRAPRLAVGARLN